MRWLVAAFLLFASASTFARAPHNHINHPKHLDPTIEHQEFLTEYGMGVQRLPMDGGRIYGWKINDSVTFGRFRGENDGFGFSFDVSRRQRIEITNEGIRWRHALGGKH